MPDEISLQDYKKAHRIIMKEKEKKHFKIHFTSYLITNSIFVAVNLLFTPDKLWSIWPLSGWGIGVFSHYMKAVHFIEKDLDKKEALAEEMAAGF